LARVCDLPKGDGSIAALRCYVLAYGKTPVPKPAVRYELLPRTARLEAGDGMLAYPLFGPDPNLGLGFDRRGNSVQCHGFPYRIDVRDSRGKIIRIVTMEHDQIPVTDRLMSEVKARIEALADSMVANSKMPVPRGPNKFLQVAAFEKRIAFPERPTAVPVTGKILVSPDGGFWLNRIDENAVDFAARWPHISDLGYPRWDVFDSAGVFVGYVQLPARFTPRAVVGRRVVGIELDSLGVERVTILEAGT
jgi:hypothetical protein